MHGKISFFNSKLITTLGTTGTGSPGVSVPDGASVNTYGTMTTLIAAASNTMDSWGITIIPNANFNPSATAGEACLDIYTGTAGSEKALVTGLLVGGCYGTAQRTFWFPLFIPAGTRIAGQLSAGTAQTSEFDVTIVLEGGGGPPPYPCGRKVTTYGTKVNNSRGQAVTPTASGGAASTTVMTTSTTDTGIYVLPSFQEEVDTTISTQTFVNIGVGIGASGAGTRIGTWVFGKDASERQSGPIPTRGVFHRVPTGSRMTMLASNGGGNDTNYGGLIHVVIV